MNAFSARVFDVLERFVVSPWSVLKVGCIWEGIDPLHLDERVLESLLPKLRAHVARITDEENASALDRELVFLVRPTASTPAPRPKAPIEFDV